MTEAKPELVECRACGHQISVKAKSCPNCGDRYTLKDKIFGYKDKIDNYVEETKHQFREEEEKGLKRGGRRILAEEIE